MKAFWDTKVTSLFPHVTYKDVLILHGTQSSAFAHGHEEGAFHALGDQSINGGYSFCRNGDREPKKLHIYILNF
jgi:hypothetical protein